MRRPSGSFVAALAIHLVMVGVFVQAIVMPRPFFPLFGKTRPAAVPAERIGFLMLPRASAVATPGRSGGDGRPAQSTTAAPLVAPAVVPRRIPVAPAQEPARATEGSGPLLGRGGPAQGIRPSYSDPRLWAPPGTVVTAPKSLSDLLDSMIVADIQTYTDSLAARPAGKDPTDWTFEKGGRKYGVDRKFIRLGPVSIPTAVLALLPLKVQGNPTVMERERVLNAMRADIQYHAQREISNADFRKAVKAIRERKDRERAELATGRSKDGGAGAKNTDAPGG